MKKVAVLFSGAGTTFEYLAQNLDSISLAITNNPNAGGIEVAKKHGIRCEIIDSSLYKVREEFDEVLVDTILKADVDLVVLAGFMRILTPLFTSKIKSINLHPSLLPRHKGVNAIEKSYHDEHGSGGVSVHWVSSELDSGEMILQREILKENLSFDEYHNEIKKIEKIALLEAIEKILE